MASPLRTSCCRFAARVHRPQVVVRCRSQLRIHGEKGTAAITVNRHFSAPRVLSTQAAVAPEAATINNEVPANSSHDSDFPKEPFHYDPKDVIQCVEAAVKPNENEAVNRTRKEVQQLCRNAVDQYERHLAYILQRLDELEEGKEKILSKVIDPGLVEVTQRMLSANLVESVIQALVLSKPSSVKLSRRVRELERLIGSIGMTPLTDELSFRLLEANGKAGNVGRALSLLQLRLSREYKPVTREFECAIEAIVRAGTSLDTGRNIYIGDDFQPTIDNPTRWLDDILFNMHQRGEQLTPYIANRMLDTYASTGRTGKALHFFYDTKYVQREPDMAGNEQESSRKPKKVVRIQFRKPPPYHKVPSLAGDKAVGIPYQQGRKPKLDWEKDPEWSKPLTAAFAFADSLMHGACGHAPIKLDVISWNILIKACCYRGSLWRAFHVMNEIMPRHGIQPDTYTYNTILAGLARVGDTDKAKELLLEMTNKGVRLDEFTVQALVDGKLNMGDIPGSITLVQDLFNQHNVLPPYRTHLKILEFALASGLVYEAKRYVYVIQQFWKWKPNEYHDPDFVEKMNQLKDNRKLSREALKKLFDYFGETLEDKDFF